MIKYVVWVFWLVATTSTLSAQEIVTDRPDFTESALTVPERWLQLESGFTLGWDRGTRSLGLPELLLRYGVSSKAELRLGLPNYNNLTNQGTTQSGFGDTYFGAKLQLGPLKSGDDLALIPALYLPTGEDGLTSDETEPELKICWSRDLTEQASLSAMAGVFWPSNSETEWLQTIAISRSVSQNSNLFLEYAGTFIKRSRPDHVLHFGYAKRPNPNIQWDVHAGFALTGPHRRPFIAAGYSQRFGSVN